MHEDESLFLVEPEPQPHRPPIVWAVENCGNATHVNHVLCHMPSCTPSPTQFPPARGTEKKKERVIIYPRRFLTLPASLSLYHVFDSCHSHVMS